MHEPSNDRVRGIPLRQFNPVYRKHHYEIVRMVNPSLYRLLVEYDSMLDELTVWIEGDIPIRVSDRRQGRWDIALALEAIQEWDRFVDSYPNDEISLIFVMGMGFGDELLRLHRLTRRCPKAVVVVLERNVAPLLAFLSMGDYSDVLINGSIVWCVGEAGISQLSATIKEKALWPRWRGKVDAISSPGRAGHDEIEQYTRLIQKLNTEARIWIESFTNAENAFKQAIQRKSERPAHVWSSGSATEYTTTPILKGILGGLRQCGLRATFTPLPQGPSRAITEYAGLVEARPDAVFFINDPTCASLPHGEFHRVVWVMDDPAFRKSRSTTPRYDPEEWVFYTDKKYEPELRTQGAEKLAFAPACSVLEREGTLKEEFRYPIVFVGMMWDPRPFLSQLARTDRDTLEEVYAEANQSNGGTIALRGLWKHREVSPSLLRRVNELCLKAGRSFGDPCLALTYATYLLDIYRRRWNIVKALLPLGLHIYGARDWLTFLQDGYAERYHGFLPYDELADLYRSAKVVVGIHSLQLPTGISIRDFDVLRAGGCLVTDPVEDMNEETLLPGRDLITAKAPEEFASIIHELLHDQDKRSVIALRGRQTVLEKHLPKHRARKMVETIR